jgi:hypothetical protein
MKTLKSYVKILIVPIVAFIMTNCEKSNEILNGIQAISEEDNITLIESIDISDELDDIIDEVIIEEFSVASKEEVSKDDSDDNKGISDCVVKTVEINGLRRTVILDFGDGCEMKNEHILSGKIMMVLVLDLDAKTIEITHSYEDFYVDDVSITGTSTISRIRENDNQNPEMTITFNKTLTWPDGETVTREGTKTREWIAGYSNKGWGDNVHLVSGNWSTTFKDGTIYSTVISEEKPLRREFSCRYIVSGLMTIDKGDKKGTIDFGNGECDNIAIFTTEGGEPEQFILRKRKRN